MFRSAGQIESISIGSKSCPAANCPGTHTVKDSKWNPHDSLADKSNVSRPSKSNELRAKKFNAIFPSRGADSLPSYNMEHWNIGTLEHWNNCFFNRRQRSLKILFKFHLGDILSSNISSMECASISKMRPAQTAWSH